MDERYEFIDTKSVLDYDGFLTDYTMYLDTETGEYVFIFGDNDYYGPDTDSVDHECESLEEAYEWFNDYDGAAGELEEVDECQSIEASSVKSSTYDEEDFDGTDLESDLIIMKQELEKVYFRLGHLQDKWFDTELSYELNDAASQVGKAFTTIRTALLVYGKQ